jgi:hypothetical protein
MENHRVSISLEENPRNSSTVWMTNFLQIADDANAWGTAFR